MPVRLEEVVIDPPGPGGFQTVTLRTGQGIVHARYWGVLGGESAVVLAGGMNEGCGETDGPARGLYERLSDELPGEGVAVLRLRFRNAAHLEESVHDLWAGLLFLESRHIAGALLVGHGAAGAVAIRTAATAPLARGVVTLALQSYGTAYAARLGKHCPVLLIHGLADRVQPPANSSLVFEQIGSTKELALFEGAGHSLDEAAEEVYRRLRAWLRTRLAETAGPPPSPPQIS